MGVPIATINQTLSTGLGGSYINDFLENGRIKGVTHRPTLLTACYQRIYADGMGAIYVAVWYPCQPSDQANGHMAHQS